MLRQLLFALLLVPAAAGARPYEDALNRTCPQKHLEWLTNGDLDFGLDNFMDTLPAGAKAALDHRMDAARKRDCAQVIAGLACSNHAAIAAMKPAERQAFVDYLCAQPVVCNRQDPCSLPGS